MGGRPVRTESGRLRRVVDRWTNTVGGRVVLVVVICALLGGASLWVVNQGSLPDRWREAIIADLSDALGVSVTVDAVRIGINRIVLHGVEVDGDTPVLARRIDVGISWRDLWRARRAPLKALHWIQVDGLHVVLPGNVWESLSAADTDPDAPIDDGIATGEQKLAPDPRPTVDIPLLLDQLPLDREIVVRMTDGRLIVPVMPNGRAADDGTDGAMEVGINGNVVWQGERLMLQRLLADGPGWELTLNGSVLPRVDVYARIASDDVAAVIAGLSDEFARSVHFRTTGRAEGEVWLTGHARKPNAWGKLRLHDMEIATPEEYAADEVVVHWTYRRPRVVELTVDAAHGAAKLRAEGTWEPMGGAVQLTVAATDLALPEDIPVLARWDIGGRADFSGTLHGTVHAPILSGTVVSDGGRLFGQPFSALRGGLELDKERFSFERARIAQGNAMYYLEGVIGFASEAAGRPGDLELVVQTDHGRMETLMAVLGWDVPVQAGLAGTLTFVGPFSAIGAEGEVSLTHGIAFGQPFDRLAGQFWYGADAFSVTNVDGSLRGGDVKAQGGGSVNGPWQIHVGVEDVPLQAISVVRDRLPDASGLVGFDGIVQSAPNGGAPHVVGTLVGRHLHLGNIDFAVATGGIAYEHGHVTTDGLTLQRHRGGTYAVIGRVADAADQAAMDVSIDVTDESLTDVLALAGLRTPVPVATGRVDASIALQGTIDNPEARIRLEAPDVAIVGRRASLALEMRVDDGRIEVEELNRAMIDGSALGG